MSTASAGVPQGDVAGYTWEKRYDGSAGGWAGRAGLQAVELNNILYVMGGRTPAPDPPTNPFASILWDDVWESRDVGRTWTRVAAGPVANPSAPTAIWAARGYFQAVTKSGAMFVMGGQNFKAGIPPCTPPAFVCSDFYNDVWRSDDARSWRKLTNAPWTARAGLSAIVFKDWIYVLGGGNGDDAAVGGSGRTLFNDVWRSRDGRSWERVVEHAEWPARAGAAVVEKDGWMYLLGGEYGFICTFTCPYFNDVWRSTDGRSWELVTPDAGWSPRPGHQCQVIGQNIICFGGFGFPTVPTIPAHPRDVWVSRDGAAWEKVSDSPWNADGSEDVKYDFDSLVVAGGPGGGRPSIFTFGGDREASFIAPDASLVDSDVWRFGP